MRSTGKKVLPEVWATPNGGEIGKNWVSFINSSIKSSNLANSNCPQHYSTTSCEVISAAWCHANTPGSIQVAGSSGPRLAQHWCHAQPGQQDIEQDYRKMRDCLREMLSLAEWKTNLEGVSTSFGWCWISGHCIYSQWTTLNHHHHHHLFIIIMGIVAVAKRFLMLPLDTKTIIWACGWVKEQRGRTHLS